MYQKFKWKDGHAELQNLVLKKTINFKYLKVMFLQIGPKMTIYNELGE